MAPFIPRLTPSEKLFSSNSPAVNNSPYFEKEKNSFSNQGPLQSSYEQDYREPKRAESNDDIHNLRFWSYKEQDDHFDEEDQEWQDSPRHSAIVYGFALAILVALSISGWFIYKWFSPKPYTSPPIIYPEVENYKILPDNPGGLVIPHQDKLVYGSLAGSAHSQSEPIEHLLPPPEEPLQLEDTQNSSYPFQQNPSHSQHNSNREQDTENTENFDSTFEQGEVFLKKNNPVESNFPLRIPSQNQNTEKTVSQRNKASYQDLDKNQSLSHLEQDSSGETSIPFESAPPFQKDRSKSSNVSSVSSSKSDASAETPDLNFSDLDNLIKKTAQNGTSKTKNTVNVEKTTLETRQNKSATQSNIINSGRFILQVASVASLELAEKELKRLQKAEPDLFKSKNLLIQKVEGDTRTTYRLIAAPFSSAHQAESFNKQLKNLKINGIVMSTP